MDHRRQWIYPVLVLAVWSTGSAYLTVAGQWGLFSEYWKLSVTMFFGSFIAGATPQGGAAVAFPVFTKIFQIPAPDARTFGLMIQSVGMTMASLTILLRRVPILPRVIGWVTVGSAAGMVLGTYVLLVPAPYPKVLFTLSLVVFAAALVISRWFMRWQPRVHLPVRTASQALLFVGVGVVGGVFTGYTGAGVDALTFVALTLTYGLDEKAATPTTVIIMAITSLMGFFLHGVVSGDVGPAWDYWLVCVPVVIVGAPLGAYALSKIGRDTLIVGILGLIAAEAVSTVLLVPFTPLMIGVTASVMAASAVCFYGMLHFRHRYLKDEARS